MNCSSECSMINEKKNEGKKVKILLLYRSCSSVVFTERAAAVASCFGHNQKDTMWNPHPQTGAFQDLLGFPKVSKWGHS